MSLEISILFGVLFVCLIGMAWGYVYYLNQERVKKELLAEIEEWLDEYKRRTTGNNRFLLDVYMLQEAFPEYSRKTVRLAWKEMVQMGWVQEDFIDKAWIVKP